jgi:hypothetical protein
MGGGVRMIEGVCGVLNWPGLGTLIASLTALFIYWRNRRNQDKDLEARREVLREMIIQNLEPAIDQILSMRSLAGNIELGDAGYVVLVEMYQPRWASRLVELQGELLSIGKAHDRPVVAFIESVNMLSVQMEIAKGALNRLHSEGPAGVRDFLKGVAGDAVSNLNAQLRDAVERAVTAKDSLVKWHA